MNKSLISTIYVRLYVRFTMALFFKNYSHAKFHISAALTQNGQVFPGIHDIRNG